MVNLKGVKTYKLPSYGDTKKWQRTVGDVVVQSGGSKDSNYIFGVQAEAWW